MAIIEAEATYQDMLETRGFHKDPKNLYRGVLTGSVASPVIEIGVQFTYHVPSTDYLKITTVDFEGNENFYYDGACWYHMVLFKDGVWQAMCDGNKAADFDNFETDLDSLIEKMKELL